MCGRYIYNHCPQQCVPKYMCVHVCVYCSIKIKFPCHGEYNIPFSTKYITLNMQLILQIHMYMYKLGLTIITFKCCFKWL